MRNVPSLETVYQDYKNKDVAFFYVYKALAHPGKSGLVQPLTLDERLAHVAKAKTQLGTKIPWLADSMTNDLKHALGERNNSEMIISPDGKIVIARSWSDPAVLRTDLAGLVGKSANTTTIADLDVKTESTRRPEKVATGVVKLIPRKQEAAVLSVKPIEVKSGEEPQPLYVKLRAEVDSASLRSGKGELYLGFFIDPIHRVHWNNLAPTLTFEIKTPDGVTLSKTAGEAPKPEDVDADADPREFLVDYDFGGSDSPGPLEVTVKYFACDDDDKWCSAATQKFTVAWTVNRDAGKVSKERPSGGGGSGGMRTSGQKGKGKGQMMSSADMMKRLDANADGKIVESEARGPVQRNFARFDANEDGAVDAAELKAGMEQMRR